MQRLLRNIFVLLLLMTGLTGQAQVRIVIVDTAGIIVHRMHSSDSAGAVDRISNWILSWRNRGYIEASADSLLWQDGKLKVVFHKGQRYYFDTIMIITAEDSAVYALSHRFFAYDRLNRMVNDRLAYWRNNGYAFARVEKNDFFIRNNRIGANIYIDRGDYFIYDTLTIADTVRINRRFLWTYLHLSPSAAYSAEDINKIQRRLSFLEFIRVKAPPQVEFYPGLAHPILFLEKKAASSAEAMVGLRYENNRITSVGRLNLMLKGLFQAETFKFSWEKPRDNWQQLEINLQLPYFMGTPFGGSLDYSLQKIDTTQVNVRFNAGMAYFPQYLNNITIAYTTENNLSVNNGSGRRSVRNKYFTTSMYVDMRDNVYNPAKGWRIDARFSYGQKFFSDSSFQSINYRADVERFFPVSKHFVFRMRFLSAGKYSPVIFDNEVMHIGGTDDFRGFADRQLSATSFWLFTVEPRLILDRYSNIFVFADRGFIDVHTINISQTQRTLAFGLGINLHTRGGILNLTYALGGIDGRFSPSASKIHLSFRVMF